jgi:hypothetical protein
MATPKATAAASKKFGVISTTSANRKTLPVARPRLARFLHQSTKMIATIGIRQYIVLDDNTQESDR